MPQVLGRSTLMFMVLAALFAAQTVVAGELQEARLRIVGGLAGVGQYTRFEEPFWTHHVPEQSGGRIVAEIAPFDKSGIRGDEMLRLLSLGVVQFGTVLPSLSIQDPELSAFDLPLLSPDFKSLRRVVDVYRPVVKRFLRDNYDTELLGVYAYPAQVIYCRQEFRGLADLAGRRIRTSGVAQSELVEALKAIPVVTPFAEMVNAIRHDVVDCAITGTMSGNAIGLHLVTNYIHEMAVSWGVSLFTANLRTWERLPAQTRDFLSREIGGLEAQIWAGAEKETGDGIDCNTGAATCPIERRGAMVRVPLLPEDAELGKSLVRSAILPRWVARCGTFCADAWDETIGPMVSIMAPRS